MGTRGDDPSVSTADDTAREAAAMLRRVLDAVERGELMQGARRPPRSYVASRVRSLRSKPRYRNRRPVTHGAIGGEGVRARGRWRRRAGTTLDVTG